MLNVIYQPVQKADIDYYLQEYDDILIGQRRTYSTPLMNKRYGPTLCAELLKRIFESYLHWSPTEVRDCLDKAVIEKMKLGPLIKRIPCPPEINRQEEFCFVAWYLYPKTRNANNIELMLKLYQDIVEGRASKYTSNYFDGSEGYWRARILLLMMIREYLPPFPNVKSLYAFFASTAGRKALEKYKLVLPMRELFGSPLAYLHGSLNKNQRSEFFFRKYSRSSDLVEERVDEKRAVESDTSDKIGAQIIVEEDQSVKNDDSGNVIEIIM